MVLCKLQRLTADQFSCCSVGMTLHFKGNHVFFCVQNVCTLAVSLLPYNFDCCLFQAFEDDKAKMRKMNENLESVVTVNVGGVHYSTSRSTLCADENSMLAAMFSGFHKIETLRDGSYFIDANGKHFGIILDYLRGRIIYSDDLPPDKEILHELRREVNFYNLLGLKDLIDVSLKGFQTRFSEWFYRYFQQRVQYHGKPDSYESKRYISFRRFNGYNCKFKNAIFAHKANFGSANLIGAKFDNCKFCQDISFKDASLVNAEFHDCEFVNDIKITFDEANLRKCKFTCNSYGSKDKYEFNLQRIRSDYHNISMISFAHCIEKMSFCNAKNVDQALFPEVEQELIEKIFGT